MAGQDDREEKNMRKFNSEHFKRKNVTWNEARKKEWAKFVHD